MKAPEHTTVVEIHQAMLRIADPQDRTRSSWKRGRTHYLTRLRLLKLRFMMRQRWFPLRAWNGLIYLLERKRVSHVHYLPPVVALEAVNGCNLRCPGCPTGSSGPLARKKGRATLEHMKAVIDQVYRRSLQMSFHHLGEPLLNEDFYAACAYATEKGLWTVIHSNLNIGTEGLARKIVSSRLCNLVVSCDGATQEVYEKYRVGGNLELVFQNLREIAQEKRKAGSPFPWLTAQFLVFDHNWHEMGSFREKALAAGADEVLFLPGCRNGTAKTGHVGAEQVFRLAALDWVDRETPATCCDLWDTFLMTYDGGIYPCCFSYRDMDLFVTPQESAERTIAESWNGREFRTVRRFFRHDAVSLEDVRGPCKHCGRVLSRQKRQETRRAL